MTLITQINTDYIIEMQLVTTSCIFCLKMIQLEMSKPYQLDNKGKLHYIIISAQISEIIVKFDFYHLLQFKK